ncbi:MAG: hypothetical protein KGO83_04000 [Paenibacillaceae bacterium]|nr:hypothetical protein [Paenibacillaceae bacterium]
MRNMLVHAMGVVLCVMVCSPGVGIAATIQQSNTMWNVRYHQWFPKEWFSEIYVNIPNVCNYLDQMRGVTVSREKMVPSNNQMMHALCVTDFSIGVVKELGSFAMPAQQVYDYVFVKYKSICLHPAYVVGTGEALQKAEWTTLKNDRQARDACFETVLSSFVNDRDLFVQVRDLKTAQGRKRIAAYTKCYVEQIAKQKSFGSSRAIAQKCKATKSKK